MKRFLALLLLLMLALRTQAWSRQTPHRAMWVWNKPSAAELFSFARANSVNELFVFVTVPVNARDRTRFATYRAAAAASGITLYALGGEKSWAENPQAAIAWKTAALGTGDFEGAFRRGIDRRLLQRRAGEP